MQDNGCHGGQQRMDELLAQQTCRQRRTAERYAMGTDSFLNGIVEPLYGAVTRRKREG